MSVALRCKDALNKSTIVRVGAMDPVLEAKKKLAGVVRPPITYSALSPAASLLPCRRQPRCPAAKAPQL